MKNRIYLQALYKHCMEFQEQKKNWRRQTCIYRNKNPKEIFQCSLMTQRKKENICQNLNILILLRA